nr:hypothetical protein CFP56_01178 [Quercus suber]
MIPVYQSWYPSCTNEFWLVSNVGKGPGARYGMLAARMSGCPSDNVTMVHCLSCLPLWDATVVTIEPRRMAHGRSSTADYASMFPVARQVQDLPALLRHEDSNVDEKKDLPTVRSTLAFGVPEPTRDFVSRDATVTSVYRPATYGTYLLSLHSIRETGDDRYHKQAMPAGNWLAGWPVR